MAGVSWVVEQGDALDLSSIADESIDSIVCDPPYNLEFMGQDWDSPARMIGTATGISGGFQRIPAGVKRPDYSKGDPRLFQQWSEAWGREALRVLKPGGHVLAFSSTRTSHRQTAGLEDAGFEIRDTIAWLYGQGFPKSHDLGPKTGGRYEGWGHALKPALEPIVIARKPLRVTSAAGRQKAGSLKDNMMEHGVGAYNIDATRIESDGSHMVQGMVTRRTQVSGDTRSSSAAGSFAAGSQFAPTNHEGGRFPANVMLDEVAAAVLDAQSGQLTSGKAPGGLKRNADKFGTAYGAFAGQDEPDARIYGDTGGASRFFYIAKPSTRERRAGLTDEHVKHTTVKPIALMDQLCWLVTPPGGTILDPFTGSGTTGIAAVLAGFNFIGIEQSEEYVHLARTRIEHWENGA